MIPAERSHLRASAVSHPGMSGKNNEDRYAVAAFWTEGEHPLPVLFAVVSDGIGGHKAGEIAAEMVVETLSQGVSSSDGSNPIQTLREAIMRSSQEILVKAESDVEQKGMGATCACALIQGDQLFIAYVGDSPIFLIRNKSIIKLSIDHTWVQEAIEAGVIEPEQAKTHPNAHVIRRYLGSKEPVEPDTRLRLDPKENNQRAESNQGLPLRPLDQIILCSDGLTDLVEGNVILNAFDNQDQDQAIHHLVDLANKRGGHDNITIVAMRVPESLPEATQPITLSSVQVQNQPFRKSAALRIALMLILFLAAAGLLYYVNRSGLLNQERSTPTVIVDETQWPTITVVQNSSAPNGVPSVNPTITYAPSNEPTDSIYTPTPQVTMTPWPTNIPPP